jgi:tetratricopeptide (TPR) repeat protein
MTNDHQLRQVAFDATVDDRRERRIPSRPHLRVLSAAGAVLLSTLTIACSPLTESRVPEEAAPRVVAAAPNAPTERAEPTDAAGWRKQGQMYAKRAYETADPSFYPLATKAYARATALTPASAPLLADRANLALALHDFNGAHRLATQALGLEPNSFAARVALFDATIEIGRYDEAATQIETLTDERPGVASLSRLSYLRQLQGDIAGAVVAMRSAVAAAADGSFEKSVALAYLGEVLLEAGQRDAAVRSFVSAQKITPLLPLAALGLAKVHAGDGDYAAAKAELSALTDRVPLPSAFGLQADIARAEGSANDQAHADELVDASVALFRSNGAIVDAELAIILADRGPASAGDALIAARRAYAERKMLFTEDAMAWALFQTGAFEEAATYARRAIATKPTIASVRWHAAKIFAASGDRTSAREQLTAASANQWFSPTQHQAQNELTTQLETTLTPTPSKVLP